MKVCFETFGCRLNRAEALEDEANYLAQGWEITDEHREADLFVVRGCSVTARAQNECERLIDHLRRHYPTIPIRINGCLERKGNAKLRKSEADEKETQKIAAVPTRTARAYLKVQDGCSGKCTFCIVPKFRGSSKSVSLEDILDKAKRFIDAGYHEIVVTGCNLALFASHGKRLPELTAELAGLSSECRIRLGSVEPGSMAMELVNVMAEQPNVCKFLHLPVQSGSNRILSAMKRPYVVRDIEELVGEATKLMPDLGLGCDLMTGFPDESDLDFNSTKSLLQRLPFTNVHVFPYSERPGTLAAGMFGAIPRGLRSLRAHNLADEAAEKRQRYARKFIGKTVKIVVEDEEKCTGWTSEYLRCEAVGVAKRKSAVEVFVTRSKNDTLYGKLQAERQT